MRYEDAVRGAAVGDWIRRKVWDSVNITGRPVEKHEGDPVFHSSLQGSEGFLTPVTETDRQATDWEVVHVVRGYHKEDGSRWDLPPETWLG